MLNHVERGRILEQPAGKYLAPAQRLIRVIPFLHKHLDESAHFGRAFPWQGSFAAGQLDHHIADPFGFANLEHQILRIVVAFV